MSAHAFTDHLKNIPLFANLSLNELDRIASVTTELNVSAGKVLFREGTTAAEMLLVLEGELEVTRDNEHVATIMPGAFAGELALLAHTPRSSRVSARTASKVLHIDGREFMPLLEDTPQIAVKMLPIIARRAVDNARHEH